MKENVGFIGLGQMGQPMVRNLMNAGYPCTVLDADPARMAPLLEAGASGAATPAEIAAAVDIVVTCLPNGDVVSEVVEGAGGLLEGSHEGLAIVDMSTNFPPNSVRLAGLLAAKGAGFLDSPISGGESAAIAGTLSVMVGGASKTFARCLPVLDVVAGLVTHMGNDVGLGGYTKLSNQILYAINLIAVVESLTFARKAGLDLDKVVAALGAGVGHSKVWDLKATKVVSHDYATQGPVWMLRKDLGYIVRSMETLGAKLPITPTLLPFYEQMEQSGQGQIDQVAITALWEKLAGIEG